MRYNEEKKPERIVSTMRKKRVVFHEHLKRMDEKSLTETFFNYSDNSPKTQMN